MPSKNVTTLASKKTGNYTVQFMRDDEDYYALAIVYTGDWASGESVEVPLEADRARGNDEPTKTEWRQWFKTVRGDHDEGAA